MKWQVREAQYGDMVRVPMGALYHYGIFVSEEEVIQFGLRFELQKDLPADEIAVLASDVNTFCGDQFLEVAVLSLKEKVQRNSSKKTVQIARSRIGERGYAILSNNCETFANECVFGKKTSSQVEDVRAFMKTLPICDVYLLPLGEGMEVKKTGNTVRDAEIEKIRGSELKLQKYAVWRLLSYAVQRTFGRDLEGMDPRKQEDGRIVLDGCCCSLTHCKRAVAVAVSRDAVGVDAEQILNDRFREGIEEKILNDAEKTLIPEGAARILEMTKRWTQKESLFKAYGSGGFNPMAQDTVKNEKRIASRCVHLETGDLILTVASEYAPQARWYLAFEKENGALSAKTMPEDMMR